MIKKKFAFTIIITIVALVIICIFIAISMSSSNSIIAIKNDTDITISGLKIIYTNSVNEISVPEIPQKQTYKTQLVLPKNFTEGSIRIFYLDKNGQNHEEYIEGYIEKSYRKNINVTIDSVDDNGILSIKIQ